MTLNTEKHFFDYKDLLRGCAGYIEHEKRDAMYKLARKLIKEANWRSQELAEGLGVLLLTWNAAFYTKYRSFDFYVLEDYLKQNTTMLKEYSERNILSYSNADDNQIQIVFKELLEVTKSVKKIGRTPVGVSKTLHLLSSPIGLPRKSVILCYFKFINLVYVPINNPACGQRPQ